MRKPLTLPEARKLAQKLANLSDDCHIICDRRAEGQGYVVVARRKATGDDFGDSVDCANPTYGEHDDKP